MSSTKTQYPLGTVAVYGPTDKLATKLVASVFPTERIELNARRKWTTDQGDIRENSAIRDELSAFLKDHHVAHAVVTEEIVGCPHEEGIDYPTGSVCPCARFGQIILSLRSELPLRKPLAAMIPARAAAGKNIRSVAAPDNATTRTQKRPRL